MNNYLLAEFPVLIRKNNFYNNDKCENNIKFFFYITKIILGLKIDNFQKIEIRKNRKNRFFLFWGK